MRVDKRFYFFVALVPMLFAASGCATYKSETVAAKPISAYDTKTTVDGVTAAVEPYENAESLKQAFYIDISKKNIRAVQLVIQNDSPDDIFLSRGDVELMGEASNFTPISSVSVADKFEKNEIAYAFWGFGMFSYMSAQQANEKMRADWFKKEFPEEKLIHSKFKSSGFLFLEVPEHLSGKTLRIPFKDVKTGETKSIELKLGDVVAAQPTVQQASVKN